MSVTAYCGLWGSGKTLAMTAQGLKRLEEGYEVYSNYGFIGGTPCETFDEVLAICAAPLRRPRCVLLDEAAMLLPAREWRNFPPALLVLLTQGRKLHVDLAYTAQRFMGVDVCLRAVTHMVINCNAFFPKILEQLSPEAYGFDSDFVIPDAWPKPTRPRLLTRTHYLADSYGTSKCEVQKREYKRWDQAIAEAYDTFYLVTAAQRVLNDQRAESTAVVRTATPPLVAEGV